MGMVHPERVLTKAGARPGDVLVLTKPLGVGIITTALKRDAAEADHVAAAVESMKRLNRKAAQLVQEVGVNACTDITGFGILGHGYEMAEKSEVRLRIHLDRLPFLPGAVQYADRWLFPGGAHNNKKFYKQHVEWTAAVTEAMELLLYTPETSGGLLVAVPAEQMEELTARFAETEEPYWVIGEVVEGQGIEMVV
jgi:selenide,water dikinase